MSNTKSTVVRSAMWLTIINIVSMLFSFLQESVFAYFFGTSAAADAYTIAVQTPVVIFAIFTTSIHNVFIPIYSKLDAQKGKDEAGKYVSNFITILLSITFVIVVICEIFTDGVVYLFAPGLADVVHKSAVDMLRIYFPTVLISQAVAVIVGILHIHGSFALPALFNVLTHVVFLIVLVIFGKDLGIYAAVIGQVLGILCNAILLFVTVRKHYRYKFVMNFSDPDLKDSCKKVVPIVIGVGAAEINKIVDRIVASFLIAGSIIALNYAARLTSAISSLFVTGISTVIYPLMTQKVANEEYKELSRLLELALSFFSILFVPLIFGSFCLKSEIISLVFERGEFNAESVKLTAPLFVCYMACLFFAAIREVSSRFFYAMGDSKTPMLNSLVGISLNIVLNIVLAHYLGALGLVIATAISTALISILILVSAKKRVESVSYKKTMLLFFKACVSSLIMFVVINLLSDINNKFCILTVESFVNKCIYLLLMVSVGVFVYFGMMLVLKAKELKVMINMVLRKVK